ncbi:hypothetical protein ACFZB4_42560 [Streptomyces pseudovenezuelae]|uniref:hypothetical protein n=1 Tax=Streptomyces pseudovenezuelae TaxID=67350 RepID=UPI0036E6A0A2
MTEDFGSSFLERGWEAPEEVILRRELVRTPGLQPEDLGVLAELLLRDPRLPSSMEAIRTDLQARGWKMGKDRYNAIAKRLTAAGHLARVSVFDASTGRPTWVTRVYRNPANNEQYVDLGIAASQQLSDELRETRDSLAPASRETRDAPGQSRIAGNPQSGAESRETRDLETRDSRGQSRNAGDPPFASPPPHPPEEEDSSSPYPLTDPKGTLPSQREQQQLQEPEFSPADLAEAEKFLQTLPRPWGAGRATARKCAPLLLREMREVEWPSIHEVDRQMLAKEILRNTEGARSVAHILPKWIKDLRLYSVVAAQARPKRNAGGREMCHKPGHGGGAFPVGDCPTCMQESRPRGEGPAPVDTAALISLLRGGQSGGAS